MSKKVIHILKQVIASCHEIMKQQVPERVQENHQVIHAHVLSYAKKVHKFTLQQKATQYICGIPGNNSLSSTKERSADTDTALE